MVIAYLSLVLALVLSITYYFGCRIDVKHHLPTSHKLMSFSAGVSITYILLELFPLFTERAFPIGRILFASVLIGFILHHFIEEELYQHFKKPELGRAMILEEESSSFLYHFIIGIVLISIGTDSVKDGILFFIPIFLYILINTLSTDPHISRLKTLFFSSATFLGAFYATFFWTNRAAWLESALIGLVAGVLLFTIVRHHLPVGKRGRIGYFLLGVLFYALVLMASWYQ